MAGRYARYLSMKKQSKNLPDITLVEEYFAETSTAGRNHVHTATPNELVKRLAEIRLFY